MKLIIKRFVLWCAVVPTMLALSGCAHYHPSTLRPLSTMPVGGSPDEITIGIMPYTLGDCKQYLDRDMLKKGYQPIQISIQNNSKRVLFFSPSAISLPVVPADEAARAAHTHTSARVLSWGIPGLFLWPFLVPAVVDGIKSSHCNEEVDKDFSSKTLQDQTVAPASRMNGLIFVPKNAYNPQFTIKLTDLETKEAITINSRGEIVR